MVGFIPSETFKIQSNCHFTYSTQNKQKTTILTATTKNRVKETSVTKKNIDSKELSVPKKYFETFTIFSLDLITLPMCLKMEFTPLL